MSDDGSPRRDNISTLLDQQPDRLENIADDALYIVRINLLVLGFFAPLLSAFLQSIGRVRAVLLNQFGLVAVGTWVLSMLISLRVYRRSRRNSSIGMEFFEAVTGDTNNDSLHRRILKQRLNRKRVSDELLSYMSVSVGFSLVSVILLMLAVITDSDEMQPFWQNVTYTGIAFLFLLIVGRDIEEFATSVVGRLRLPVEAIPGHKTVWNILSAAWDDLISVVFSDITEPNVGVEFIRHAGTRLADQTGLPPEAAYLVVLVETATNEEPISHTELSKRASKLGITDATELIPELINEGYLITVDGKYRLGQNGHLAMKDLPRSAQVYRLEARRREYWREGRWLQWFTLTSSKVTTLYGESPWRVVAISQYVIFTFALLYPLFGIQIENRVIQYGGLESMPEILLRSLYVSSSTFTTLGYAEFQLLGLARFLAVVESLIGALLIALLVFTLGRRVAE